MSFRPSVRTLVYNLVALAAVVGIHRGVTSVGEPKVTWARPRVRICVGDGSHAAISGYSKLGMGPTRFGYPSAELVKIARDVLTAEYAPERTGISFYGFDLCDADASNGDAVFTVSPIDPAYPTVNGASSLGENGKIVSGSTWIDHQDGTSSLARGYEAKNSTTKPFVHLFLDLAPSALSAIKQHELRFVILHEFGHLAGLRHEHIRKQAKKDVFCRATKQELAEEPDDTTIQYAPYDPYSVMSYCFTNWMVGVGYASFYVAEDKITAEDYRRASGNGHDGKMSVVEKRVLPKIDETILALRPTSTPGIELATARPGLSRSDVHTLKCLYRVYNKADLRSLCGIN